MVLGDTGGVWYQTADGALPKDVMGEADNVGPVGEVLKQTFCGNYRGDAWRLSIIHHIKHLWRKWSYPFEI